MEATSTSTSQPGVNVNTETGNAKVPNNQGGVSDEVRRKFAEMFGPEAVIMSKEVYEKFVQSLGAQAEDAKARGMKYEPRLAERFTNMTKKNLNPLNVFVAVVIAGGVYWVGKKGGALLARKMGWNLFGNVVVDNTVQGEEIGRRREAPRPRISNIPSSPTATA